MFLEVDIFCANFRSRLKLSTVSICRLLAPADAGASQPDFLHSQHIPCFTKHGCTLKLETDHGNYLGEGDLEDLPGASKYLIPRTFSKDIPSTIRYRREVSSTCESLPTEIPSEGS